MSGRRPLNCMVQLQYDMSDFKDAMGDDSPFVMRPYCLGVFYCALIVGVLDHMNTARHARTSAFERLS